jgi:hypothetical protein
MTDLTESWLSMVVWMIQSEKSTHQLVWKVTSPDHITQVCNNQLPMPRVDMPKEMLPQPKRGQDLEILITLMRVENHHRKVQVTTTTILWLSQFKILRRTLSQRRSLSSRTILWKTTAYSPQDTVLERILLTDLVDMTSTSNRSRVKDSKLPLMKISWVKDLKMASCPHPCSQSDYWFQLK